MAKETKGAWLLKSFFVSIRTPKSFVPEPPMKRGVRSKRETLVSRASKMGLAARTLARSFQSNPSAFGISSVTGEPPKQTPFAAVLGCADARAPVDLVFERAVNELFVVRVAGNVLGDECLGSLEYAVANLDTIQVFIILGHTGCGAVTTAVDAFLNPDSIPERGVEPRFALDRRPAVRFDPLGVDGARRRARYPDPELLELPSSSDRNIDRGQRGSGGDDAAARDRP